MPPSDSTRIMWANSKAREIWGPRLQAVSNAWLEVELASVRLGLRSVALVYGEKLVQKSGLSPALIVDQDRFAVGPLAEELARAYRKRDDDAVGRLLRYPRCCRQFFQRVKVNGNVDTTWDMAGPDPLHVSGPLECNILGRWLGVRLVPHLPCSFTCDDTWLFAQSLDALWPRKELGWARDILSWPIEWSAKNGLAEIKYPILKVSTRTTVLGNRVVRRIGTSYPDEGARGLVFPYQQQPTKPLKLRRSKDWTENGFNSEANMERAHAMILAELNVQPPAGLVVDLGAGNGKLLERIRDDFQMPIMGIEMDYDKVRGRGFLVCGNLADPMIREQVTNCDTFIVSQRRFEEMPDLEIWARANARQVLVYSYDDPMFARVDLGERAR